MQVCVCALLCVFFSSSPQRYTPLICISQIIILKHNKRQKMADQSSSQEIVDTEESSTQVEESPKRVKTEDEPTTTTTTTTETPVNGDNTDELDESIPYRDLLERGDLNGKYKGLNFIDYCYHNNKPKHFVAGLMDFCMGVNERYQIDEHFYAGGQLYLEAYDEATVIKLMKQVFNEEGRLFKLHCNGLLGMGGVLPNKKTIDEHFGLVPEDEMKVHIYNNLDDRNDEDEMGEAEDKEVENNENK